MKKNVVVILTLLALLFAFLPTQAALAEKAPEETTLNIRNRTGFPLTLTLINVETGAHEVFTFAPGTTQTLTLAGKYRYYAQTACGIRQGGFQLFGARELYFACGLGLDFSFHNANGWYTAPEPLSCPTGYVLNAEGTDCTSQPPTSDSLTGDCPPGYVLVKLSGNGFCLPADKVPSN
jgi:hypothetical protein